MKKITLTASKLRAIKPKPQTYEVRDAGAPGLRVRIYPNRRKVFRWHYKDVAGKSRVRTLGEYAEESPKLTLAQARSQLDQLKNTPRGEVLLKGERREGDKSLTVEKLLSCTGTENSITSANDA